MLFTLSVRGSLAMGFFVTGAGAMGTGAGLAGVFEVAGLAGVVAGAGAGAGGVVGVARVAGGVAAAAGGEKMGLDGLPGVAAGAVLVVDHVSFGPVLVGVVVSGVTGVAGGVGAGAGALVLAVGLGGVALGAAVVFVVARVGGMRGKR